MYKVELLTYDDLVWAVEVAATRMLTEEVKRPELIHKETLYKLVEKAIIDETALVVKNEKPIGMIGGLLFPNMFNPNRTTLVEVMWWLNPDYRKTRAGVMLLNEFIKLGDEVADETTLSLLSTSPVNHASLEKRGFTLEEYSFRR